MGKPLKLNLTRKRNLTPSNCPTVATVVEFNSYFASLTSLKFNFNGDSKISKPTELL